MNKNILKGLNLIGYGILGVFIYILLFAICLVTLPIWAIIWCFVFPITVIEQNFDIRTAIKEELFKEEKYDN